MRLQYQKVYKQKNRNSKNYYLNKIQKKSNNSSHDETIMNPKSLISNKTNYVKICTIWSCGSVVERSVHIGKVRGSTPFTTTMSVENFTKLEGLRRSEMLLYSDLLDNLGQPRSVRELVEIGNIYKNVVPERISFPDKKIIFQRIYLIRKYLEDHPQIGLSLFNIRGEDSYILIGDELENNTVEIPLAPREELNNLTQEEISFLSQCKRTSKYVLSRVLTPLQLNIFLILASNKNRFMSNKEIEQVIHDDEGVYISNNLPAQIYMIRKRLSGSDMKITCAFEKGYRFERTISSQI